MNYDAKIRGLRKLAYGGNLVLFFEALRDQDQELWSACREALDKSKPKRKKREESVEVPA